MGKLVSQMIDVQSIVNLRDELVLKKNARTKRYAPNEKSIEQYAFEEGMQYMVDLINEHLGEDELELLNG